MDDIVGIYRDLPDEAWYPNEIIVNMNNSEIDGNYIKHDKGGGGIIFLNESTDTVLKIKFFADENDEEVIYQKKAGEIGPEIFYDSFRKVNSDISDKNSFNNEKVQVIIMEYLNPDEWIPLQKKELLNTYYELIFETIYKLVFKLNMKNTHDFVGNTGPHIFLNQITNKVKVVDYGFFKHSTNPPYDFLMMVQEIQDIYERWPSEEIMDCYKKIMDLNEQNIEQKCKELILYEGRLFLEKKDKKDKKDKRKDKLGINKHIKKKTKKKKLKGGSIKKSKKRKKKHVKL